MLKSSCEYHRAYWCKESTRKNINDIFVVISVSFGETRVNEKKSDINLSFFLKRRIFLMKCICHSEVLAHYHQLVCVVLCIVWMMWWTCILLWDMRVCLSYKSQKQHIRHVWDDLRQKQLSRTIRKSWSNEIMLLRFDDSFGSSVIRVVSSLMTFLKGELGKGGKNEWKFRKRPNGHF